MKILIIVSSLGYGGSEKIVSETANYYESIGHKVDLILLNRRQYEYTLKSHIKICEARFDLQGYARLRRVVNLMYRCLCIRRKLKEFQPDVLVSHGTQVNVLSAYSNLFFRYRHIGVIHERIYKFSPLKRAIIGFAYRSLISSLVAPSSKTKDYAYNEYGAKSHVVPNPILVTSGDACDDFQIDNQVFQNKKVLISIGRLEKEKNYPLLLEIVEEVLKRDSNFFFVIVGSGSEKNSLLHMLNLKNISQSVKLINPPANLKFLYQHSWAYLTTSKSESFGLTIAESISESLPVIAYSNDLPEELFLKNDFNSILFNSKKDSAKEIAQKIVQLSKRDDLYENLVKGCKITAEKYYSVEQYSNKVLGF